MIPQPDGVEKKLSSSQAITRKRESTNDLTASRSPNNSLDGDLIQVSTTISQTTRARRSGKDLFPLTSEEQQKYDLNTGSRQTDRKNVSHIGFRPKDESDITWAGEAYVDATEFRPVHVFTNYTPHAGLVRTMLGTDVPGIDSTWPTNGRKRSRVSRFLRHGVCRCGCFLINRNI